MSYINYVPSLSFTRYIDITSAVIGNSTLVGRNFGLRLMTVNPLLPPQSYLQSSTLSAVGNYFGTDSDEYKRANFYLSRISKSGRKPQLISYARWVEDAVAPYIFGAVKTQSVGLYTGIMDGSFSMTIGGVTNNFTGIDFSAAITLSDVASIIEAKINAASGIQWTAATVTFDAVRGSFNFEGGDAVAAQISVVNYNTGTPILALLGWLTGAIIGYGSLAETLTQTMNATWQASNNFGSFIFIPELNLTQETELSSWTNSMNVRVAYFPRSSINDASSYEAALAGYSGVGLTISPLSNEYPEQAPAMVFAATDYTQVNSVQNYMYQQFALTPSVTDDATADTLDQLRVNYYAATQESGDLAGWYQRGKMFGLDTAPTDMNTFTNEIWLKDAIGVAVLNLQLGLPNLPANSRGLALFDANVQPVINQAVSNGTISVGNTLNSEQIAAVTELSGDPNAWQQVQSIGYYYKSFVVQVGDEYDFDYILIYVSNKAVRKVTGLDAQV